MNFQTFRKTFVCDENIYSASLFLNKSTYVVVSEEQKAFLYLVPQKLVSESMCLFSKLPFYTPLLKQIQVSFSSCFCLLWTAATH